MFRILGGGISPNGRQSSSQLMTANFGKVLAVLYMMMGDNTFESL